MSTRTSIGFIFLLPEILMVGSISMGITPSFALSYPEDVTELEAIILIQNELLFTKIDCLFQNPEINI
ncbi:MAG: hypothetical protein ACPKPY_00475 [Nitrososphaeraceae archaeon]